MDDTSYRLSPDGGNWNKAQAAEYGKPLFASKAFEISNES